jgi:hypothetical protein
MSRGDVLTLTPSEQRRRLATTPPPLLHNTGAYAFKCTHIHHALDCTSVANVSTTSPSSSNEQSLPTDVMAAMCTPAYLQHVFNERDKAWRARHARELDRVHAEHAHMLHMLHTEVERLQAMLRGRVLFFNHRTHTHQYSRVHSCIRGYVRGAEYGVV